jgi:hypothetical protein
MTVKVLISFLLLIVSGCANTYYVSINLFPEPEKAAGIIKTNYGDDTTWIDGVEVIDGKTFWKIKGKNGTK